MGHTYLYLHNKSKLYHVQKQLKKMKEFLKKHLPSKWELWDCNIHLFKGLQLLLHSKFNAIFKVKVIWKWRSKFHRSLKMPCPMKYCMWQFAQGKATDNVTSLWTARKQTTLRVWQKLKPFLFINRHTKHWEIFRSSIW